MIAVAYIRRFDIAAGVFGIRAEWLPVDEDRIPPEVYAGRHVGPSDSFWIVPGTWAASDTCESVVDRKWSKEDTFRAEWSATFAHRAAPTSDHACAIPLNERRSDVLGPRVLRAAEIIRESRHRPPTSVAILLQNDGLLSRPAGRTREDAIADRINELEHSYGEGAFRDGLIRDEIARLRADLARTAL